MLADSRKRIGQYIQDLSKAGHSDSHQLAVYGLAYLKELHEGPDPRFTGCWPIAWPIFFGPRKYDRVADWRRHSTSGARASERRERMCSVVNVRSVERRRAVNSESARAPLSIIAPLYEKARREECDRADPDRSCRDARFLILRLSALFNRNRGA
jgi:hypothetical protein